MKRALLVVGVLAAVGLWSAQEAEARAPRRSSGSSWSFGFNYGGIGGHFSRAPRYYHTPRYYAAPRYYAPPTYYYAPPAYYYAPPPTYYAPPPVYYYPRSSFQFYYGW